MLPDIIADPVGGVAPHFHRLRIQVADLFAERHHRVRFSRGRGGRLGRSHEKNREGAQIRTASDRRFKAADIKKLQKSPGF